MDRLPLSRITWASVWLIESSDSSFGEELTERPFRRGLPECPLQSCQPCPLDPLGPARVPSQLDAAAARRHTYRQRRPVAAQIHIYKFPPWLR